MSETPTALAGAPILAFVVATVLAFFLSRGRAARFALDHPNARSLHVTAVPRTGGLAVLIAAMIAWTLGGPGLPAPLASAVVLVAAISLADDVRHIPAALRLFVHIAAGAYVVNAMAGPGLSPIAQAALAIAIAWLANLYNFMDGSDGLAGGMALIGFSFYGAAALVAGDTAFAAANLVIAASAAGFLLFNFHPAKIFLGDVGSVPLGFLAGALGVLGWLKGAWPMWFPLVVFSAFIVDSTVTLTRRLLRGVRVWIPHRDHYYQRLVQIGWGHARTAWAEYALMIATGAFALIALTLDERAQLGMLVVIAAVYATAILLIESAWRHRLVAREP